MSAPEVIDTEDFTSFVGQSIHTALRKAVDTAEAGPLWKAIAESGETWGLALDAMADYFGMSYPEGFTWVPDP